MPLVRDVMMTRRPVCVAPDETVRAAMELLRTEQLDVLPVARDGKMIGSVSTLSLFRLYGEMPLSEALREPLPTIAWDAPLGTAVARMAESHARALVVVRGDELVGMLTERDLADSWGSVPDPLTALPWQDQMRRWASSHLRRGREIAILFLDLNGFGAFNKERGHVLGDRMLQGVAQALREAVTPEQDYLCRYGGDEFVVATTRPLLQARSLALALRRAIGEMPPPEEGASLSVAIGIAGGQRSGLRPGSHPPAMLDDLINLASRASTHAKGVAEQCYVIQTASDVADTRRPGQELLLARAGTRTRLEAYQVNQRGETVSATVSLRRGDRAEEAQVTRPADEITRAVADATASALAAFLPGDVVLDVTHVTPCSLGGEGEVVGAVVLLHRPDGHQERLFGAAPLLADRSRSVINAVLDATNRRLGFWLSRPDAPLRTAGESVPPPAQEARGDRR
jgi:diguanylate cyclase (GGDEF)-like protein